MMIRTSSSTHSVSEQLPPTTTSTLAADPIFGYKLRVLLYDLYNMDNNASFAARLDTVTDVQYLSLPYFTPEEAQVVKGALVDHELPQFTTMEDVDGTDFDDDTIKSGLTVEATIEAQMAMFLEKRRASGDSRPCGPHTIAPLYRAIFGIEKQETMEVGFSAG